MRASNYLHTTMKALKNSMSTILRMDSLITILRNSCTDRIPPKMPFRHLRTPSSSSVTISKLLTRSNTSKNTNTQQWMRTCQLSSCRHHNRTRHIHTQTSIISLIPQHSPLNNQSQFSLGQVRQDPLQGLGRKHCIMNLIMVRAIVNSLTKTNLMI